MPRSRMWSQEAAWCTQVGVFNGAFVLVFLRLTIPRLLALESMGDVGEFASSMGLPGKAELQSYLAYVEGMTVLATLLREVAVSRLPGVTPRPAALVTLRPADALPLVVSPRA